ncbi:uncharacterized protein LOC143856211 isoform X2 [Tasmannia lanceolata]|uniref:uncharacterized protein LOC143856211 isoform X2 n=1 Tax=Tasmannia lanceolata TaxID=3420 RepID=UPI00406282B6
MEKHMQRKVSFEENHPGCMWRILHLFDFHQRVMNRKMISDNKHYRGRRAGGIKIPRTKLNTTGADARELMNEEEAYCLLGDKMKETNPTRKKSGRRIKALIAEEMSKEQNQKRPIARLTRTYSIHHMEDAELDLISELSADGDSPIIELHPHETNPCTSSVYNPILVQSPDEPIVYNKRCEVCGTMNSTQLGHDQLYELRRQFLEKHEILEEKLDEARAALLEQTFVDGKELARDVVAVHQSKEFLDALELFNANREVFLKILQDPSSVLANHSQCTSSAELVLTKSGSFPGAEPSVRKNVGLIKLKHKDIMSFAKRQGKLEAENSPTVLNTEDNYGDSTPLTTDDKVGSNYQSPNGNDVTEIAGVSSSSEPLLGAPPHASKNERDNGIARNRFKDIKQKITHAINESKKEQLRIAMDGILHRIPNGRKASKNVKLATDSPRSGYESDGSVSLIRRSHSLTESLERYSHLLEPNLSRDTPKLRSASSKWEGSQDDRASKTFGRILSLPDFKSYSLGIESSDLESEVPRDTLHTVAPTMSFVDCSADAENIRPDEQKSVNTLINTESSQLNSSIENGNQEQCVQENASGPIDGDPNQLLLDTKGDENAEVVGIVDDFTVGESSYIPLHEQEIEPAITKPAQPSPVSVLIPCFQEDITSPVKFLVSEGSQLKPRHIHFDELNPRIDLEDQLRVDVHDGVGNVTYVHEVQIPHNHTDSDSLDFQVDTMDEAQFNYVRDVLKISGFSGNELLGMWYSPNQPLDPLLFEELEGSPLKRDTSGEEMSSGCENLLLFDLINEVLLEIYERSFTHFSSLLFINSHIRPMPVGYHVLEEVWRSISCHLSLQPERNPSLDCVVGRDLAKSDGWMNLQFDTEYVGLELEEWILDDLLDEETLELFA